jgi:hypothetical protein
VVDQHQPGSVRSNRALAESSTCWSVRAKPDSRLRLSRAPMLLASSAGRSAWLPAFLGCRQLADRSAGRVGMRPGCQRPTAVATAVIPDRSGPGGYHRAGWPAANRNEHAKARARSACGSSCYAAPHRSRTPRLQRAGVGLAIVAIGQHRPADPVAVSQKAWVTMSATRRDSSTP